MQGQDSLNGEGHRIISFDQLSSTKGPPKPAKTRARRERDTDSDPYYQVIDTSYDFLLARKRGRGNCRGLSPELIAVLNDLETILKEMTMAALDDEFDYHVQMNRYYVNMLRVYSLSALLGCRVRTFTRTQGAALTTLTAIGDKTMPEALRYLNQLVNIGDKLSLESNLFMDHIEKAHPLDMRLKDRRSHIYNKVKSFREQERMMLKPAVDE